MVFFLAWLVQTQVCEEASFFCMLVGHTYSEIDQTFSTLIGQLYLVAIHTVTSLCDYIFQFLRPYRPTKVVELFSLWDWKGFFAPHVYERLSGFATGQYGSGMHEFLLRKGRDGNVRLYVRKSSAASTWLPEGEGLEIFKTVPTGHPELAQPAKPDHVWQRSAVEQTVRRWSRFIFESPAETQRINEEWDARFQALPENNDINTLPEALKLKWVDLPKRTLARRVLQLRVPDEARGGAYPPQLAPPPPNPPLTLNPPLTPP